MGQATSSAITNSDVISMTKAGIGEQTIILAIQRGPVKFDTSPLALIALQQAGVPDRVLNAILSVPKPPNPAPLASQTQAVSQPANQQANPQGNAQPPIPNEKGPSYCASRAGETIAASTARTNCCERGSGTACSNLAHFYETGSQGLPTDLSIAHELKEKACEQKEWGDCSVRIGNPSEKIAFDRAMAMTDPAAKEATLITFLQVYPQTLASSAVYGTLTEIRDQAAKDTPPPPSPPAVAIQRLPQPGTQGFTLRFLPFHS